MRMSEKVMATVMTSFDITKLNQENFKQHR